MNANFETTHNRKPVAGIDYDPDAPMCQDDHDYLAGEGQYKNPAAVALGSMTSAKKAKTSAENGKRGGRPTLEQQARRRVSKSPTLSQYESAIFYDWPNWEEHLRWVIKAPVAEIVDWAQTV